MASDPWPGCGYNPHSHGDDNLCPSRSSFLFWDLFWIIGGKPAVWKWGREERRCKVNQQSKESPGSWQWRTDLDTHGHASCPLGHSHGGPRLFQFILFPLPWASYKNPTICCFFFQFVIFNSSVRHNWYTHIFPCLVSSVWWVWACAYTHETTIKVMIRSINSESFPVSLWCVLFCLMFWLCYGKII